MDNENGIPLMSQSLQLLVEPWLEYMKGSIHKGILEYIKWISSSTLLHTITSLCESY